MFFILKVNTICKLLPTKQKLIHPVLEPLLCTTNKCNDSRANTTENDVFAQANKRKSRTFILR